MEFFDDPHAEVRVVIDSHGHPSLWPAAFPVPFGWTTSRCPAPREEAQTYLDCLQRTPRTEKDPHSAQHGTSDRPQKARAIDIRLPWPRL